MSHKIFIPIKKRILILDLDKYLEIKNNGFSIRGANNYVDIYSKETKAIKIHRYILNCPKNLVVDHINGDTFDNRVSNIRICTVSDNNKNSCIRKGKKTSRYKGVYRRNNYKKNPFVVKMQVNNKYYHIGCYPSEEEAVKAYNDNATKLFGKFAKLNQL